MEYIIDSQTQQMQIAAGKDSGRFSLNGIYFNESHIFSTDGHRLVVRKKPEGSNFPKNKIVKFTSPKQKKPSSGLPFETYTETGDRILGTNTQNVAEYIDADYPDCSVVIPRSEAIKSMKALSFDVKHLKAIVDAIGDDPKEQIVTLFFRDETSALVVTADGELDAFGILMPCKLEREKAEATFKRVWKE